MPIYLGALLSHLDNLVYTNNYTTSTPLKGKNICLKNR